MTTVLFPDQHWCRHYGTPCTNANIWNECKLTACNRTIMYPYVPVVEIKREENKMTNREWLERLSDEKLAVFYATQSTICEMCDYIDVCISEITSEKCSEGVESWLQAEHKEPKKELTQAQLCKAFELKFGKRRAISLDEIKDVAKEIFK